MKTKIIIFITAMFCLTNNYANAQSYEKAIELNVGLGLDKTNKYGIGLSMINGYRFNDYFYLGAGIGYKNTRSLYYTTTTQYGYYYESFDNRNLIQLYGRLKVNLSSNKISPFLQIDLGGSIDVNSNKGAGNSGGLIVEPTFGMRFKNSKNKSSIDLSLGYNIQKMEYRSWNLITHSDKMVDATAGQLVLRFCYNF